MKTGMMSLAIIELPSNYGGVNIMTTNSIETERLLIRSTREEDGEFCLSMWLDEEMGKYLSGSAKKFS